MILSRSFTSLALGSCLLLNACGPLPAPPTPSTTSWYKDADSDGYGDATAEVVSSVKPDNTYVADNTDCDDTNSNIFPPCLFPGSTLLNSYEGLQINTWIGSPDQVWTLCFKYPEDGNFDTVFHSQCDGLGDTITVVTLDTGKKIGGYAASSWVSTFGYSSNSTSFLFSLTNTYKHTIINSSYAQFGASSYGPTFGGGHDLKISASERYCNLGHSYSCRVGSYGSSECQNDFCGLYSGWSVVKMEVWYKE